MEEIKYGIFKTVKCEACGKEGKKMFYDKTQDEKFLCIDCSSDLNCKTGNLERIHDCTFEELQNFKEYYKQQTDIQENWDYENSKMYFKKHAYVDLKGKHFILKKGEYAYNCDEIMYLVFDMKWKEETFKGKLCFIMSNPYNTVVTRKFKYKAEFHLFRKNTLKEFVQYIINFGAAMGVPVENIMDAESFVKYSKKIKRQMFTDKVMNTINDFFNSKD